MQICHPEAAAPEGSAPPSVKEIAAHCNSFKGADPKRSIFQLATTLALFAATVAFMFYGLNVSYGITALLILPAAGLLTRLFIIQHDCGHGSFFNSKKANDWTGRFLGLLTVTPYDFWRRAHNVHHAASGDLDRRSIGGIDTITVREYNALPKWRKVTYRIYRNPFFLLVLGTPFYTLFVQRIPLRQSTHFHDNYQTLSPSSIWKSIMLTNASIAVFYGLLAYVTGIGAVAAVYLPILVATSWIGGWLFFIQHQFEGAYWKPHENWNRQEAALMGSSYYALPKILQWFTGNIGLHHIHHLCSKIPNYKLQACMDARPELGHINRLTVGESLKCLNLKLWDEQKGRMVGLDHPYADKAAA